MADHPHAILNRIPQRQAKVDVYGLGYVGLPVAVAFAQSGFRVVGFDVDARKVAAVNAAESYICTAWARTCLWSSAPSQWTQVAP